MHRLQKELEKIRRNGDSEQVSYQVSPLRKKDDYFDEIFKGYENTFGKVVVSHSKTASKTGESIVSSGKLSKKRSKSSLYSTASYTGALAKLGFLTQEEEKLKSQKQELMKILEKTKNNPKD